MDKEKVWQLKCNLFEDKAGFYLNAFNEFGASVAWEQKELKDEGTLFVATFSMSGDFSTVQKNLTEFLDSFSLQFPKKATLEVLEHKNWLEENRRSFRPLTIGSFFFYGSHYDGPHPSGKISLKLDAAAAFGSGEHATTKGSLLALEKILKTHSVSHMLDMGCGSGILSMAAGMLANMSILSCDIDEESVEATKENMENNKIQCPCAQRLGVGYETLREGESFDLIVSNILAKPLMHMAPDLSRVLNVGGHAVLSGFLQEQQEQVVSTHIKESLTFVEANIYDGWVTAILKK